MNEYKRLAISQSEIYVYIMNVNNLLEFIEQQIISLTQRLLFPRCSVKRVFFKISQNSRENTCARLFFK